MEFAADEGVLVFKRYVVKQLWLNLLLIILKIIGFLESTLAGIIHFRSDLPTLKDFTIYCTIIMLQYKMLLEICVIWSECYVFVERFVIPYYFELYS